MQGLSKFSAAMTDSKFYRFLKELQPKELKRFRKYLESPYFNSHAKVLNLFEIFERHLLSQNSTELNKELIWEELYPNESFDYEKLRKLLHNLMDLGYDFLAQQIYDESPAEKANSLLQMLANKQMLEYMPNIIQSGIKGLAKQQNRNGIFYYDLYSIEKYKYILTNVEGTRVNKTNLQNLNLNVIDDYLNIFFLSEKLRNYCLILSWSKMIEIKSELPFLNEVLTNITKLSYYQFPTIEIYHNIYSTFIEPDNVNHFYKLKELIQKHIHLFPPAEARDIVNSAINYTIQQQNKGNLQFAQDNFELWQHSLKTDVILINGELSPWSFKNIITLALRLGKFAWVEKFISDYGSKINIIHRDNALNYNLATLYFYQKNYDNAIPLLQKVQFDEINYGLDAKSILLACYYELDEFDPLFSHIESFKVFVKRNKSIAEARKKSYLELIKFTKELSSTTHDIKTLKKLKSSIEQSKAMSKKWLLEKIDELL